jgi:hypothetical protein
MYTTTLSVFHVGISWSNRMLLVHPCHRPVQLIPYIYFIFDFCMIFIRFDLMHVAGGIGCMYVGNAHGWYRCARAVGHGAWACAMHEMQWLCDGRVCRPFHSLFVFMSLSVLLSRFHRRCCLCSFWFEPRRVLSMERAPT